MAQPVENKLPDKFAENPESNKLPDKFAETSDKPVEKPVEKPKKETRLSNIQKLNTNPIELPLVSAIELEPIAYQMLGRLINIINDPKLFVKLRNVIHKKFDLTINETNKQIKEDNPQYDVEGGGREESYFTQKECSFF